MKEEEIIKEAKSLWSTIVKKLKEVRSDNNTVVLIICLLVSTLFWFLKALNDNYSTEVEFPIEFTNVPDNYTLTGELPDKLIATVEDDGFTIMRYKFSFVFSSFKFDVSKNFDKGHRGQTDGELLIAQAALKKGVADALISRTNLISVYPESVKVSYSKLHEKKVPIQVLGEISVENQHIVNGSISTSPDSVVIIGSNSLLESTRVAYTQPLRVQNLEDTLKRMVTLQPVDGITYSEERVLLCIPVESFTEKIVEVPIVGRNFPDSLDIRSFPGVAQVSAICGLSVYNRITSADFVCYIDYDKVKDKSDGHVELSVISNNSLAQRVKLRTFSVDYLIEKQGQ